MILVPGDRSQNCQGSKLQSDFKANLSSVSPCLRMERRNECLERQGAGLEKSLSLEFSILLLSCLSNQKKNESCLL